MQDDDARDGEPQLPAADEVEVGLAVVQPRRRRSRCLAVGSAVAVMRSLAVTDRSRPASATPSVPQATRPTPTKRALGEEAGCGRAATTSGRVKKQATNEVEDRRQAEEEGEAAHRADGEPAEQDGADERRRRRRRGSCGRRRWKPRSVELRSVSPGLHLVLQALEVDDVGVDGHADRHDDAGDAGQGERQPCARRQAADDRVDERRPHDEAERPRPGRGPGSRGSCRGRRAARPTRPAMRPACSESSPSVADTVCTALPLELDRQRAVAQHEGEVLGLGLG